MSLEDCIQRGVDGEEMDRLRGERAQKMWREIADRYERQGRPRHMAEALAAEDVKAAFKKEAGDIRHVYLAKMGNLREIGARVDSVKSMTQHMEDMENQHRGLLRLFNHRMSDYLKKHNRNIFGNSRNPAQLRNIVRELHGEATGDASARELAEAIRSALEDMRVMFNEAGGLAGKMEDWGLPHSHSRRAVTRAGFDAWHDRIANRLNWSRMTDPLTGRTMENTDAAMRRRFLKETFDNIVSGKDAREVVYGRNQGVAMYKKHSERRVLHFNSADDWIEYNREFGTGDPFKSLQGHVHRMARDIVLMRNYGPNPGLGVEYETQLRKHKAFGDVEGTAKAEKDTGRARRMFRILSGGSIPDTPTQDWMATFFSSLRHGMSAAFLDRAILASLSDLNSMRLAAEAVGMNPANLVSRHAKLMAGAMDRDEALRAGYVADTLSDAGANLARFQQEWAPADIAERLSSASMRVQGLSHWTDMARAAFQMEFAGLMASQASKPLSEVDAPLRGLLERADVTADEWASFTRAESMFTAENGATFLSPFWWRDATTMDRRKADELFFKIQGMIEDQMEYAVPTQSIWARSHVDPAAYDLPPGSILYEVAKSGLMFKSFAMTFTVNQVRRISAQPTLGAKIGYGLNLAAGATVMGAISLQITNLVSGRDPEEMDPTFWVRAVQKGGGFGIMGDIVAAGQTSWGGGFGSYIAGPMPQLASDIWGISVKNAWQAATGQETNFAAEAARLGRRYTPMGQTPAVGPAIDRLFWDQLQLLLDPESVEDLHTAARRRTNLYGNDYFWMPGSPLPDRAPAF